MSPLIPEDPAKMQSKQQSSTGISIESLHKPTAAEPAKTVKFNQIPPKETDDSTTKKVLKVNLMKSLV